MAGQWNAANGKGGHLSSMPVAIAGDAMAAPVSDSASPLCAPSDDDEMAGVERLVADPDSPTSRLLERAAQRSLQEVAHGGRSPGEKRFSYMNDIARNPHLARAACAEIDAASLAGPSSGSGTPIGAAASAAAASGAFSQHRVEIDRQAAVIAALDRDAAQENSINHQMSAVMLGRLQSGRAAAERVLSVLQAFSTAEAGYARAVEAAAKIQMVSDNDGASLRAAMDAFSDLPLAMCTSHAAVAAALTGAIRAVHAVVADLRVACEEVGHGTQSTKRSVDAARLGLKVALTAHQDACRAFDAAVVGHQRWAAAAGSGGRPPSVEIDPWVTEGRLVQGQAALHRAQNQQRRYLAVALRRVGVLERQRMDAECSALAEFTFGYRAAALPQLQAQVSRLEALLEGVDCEADLAAFTETAASSVHSADALSARQAEVIEQLKRDLLASAEIVRQGDMERLDLASSRWLSGYAVLTRAAFLHWFAAPKDGSAGTAWGPAGAPAASLNLSRCSFDPGEAPVFRLIEAGSFGWLPLGPKQRPHALRCADVEGCMEWTADLREAIAASTR